MKNMLFGGCLSLTDFLLETKTNSLENGAVHSGLDAAASINNQHNLSGQSDLGNASVEISVLSDFRLCHIYN